MTRKEREIQQKLRGMAREEREKGGKNVKVGYKKVYMRERWYKWNEKEGRLEEDVNERRA